MNTQENEYFVYAFAVDGDHPSLEKAIKIGVAKNPASRLFGCQTGSPVRLYIKKTWRFDSEFEARAFERACHTEFAGVNLIREWFSITIEEIDQLRSVFYGGQDINEDVSALIKALAGQEKMQAERKAAEANHAPDATRRAPKHAQIVSKSDLLITADAADYISKSLSWLNKTRLNGSGPVYLKVGGAVRYRVSDLDEWLAGTKRTAVYDFANRAA